MKHTHSGVAAVPNDAEAPKVKFDVSIVTERQRINFDKHIDRSPHPRGCWIWTAGLSQTGYGCFRFANEKRGAHQFSYLINKGSLMEGLFVIHSCDNPPCVNPEHLSHGTPQQNSTDMVNKKRQATGDRCGVRLYPETRPRGDNHHTRRIPETLKRGTDAHNAVLNEALVLEIWRMNKQDGIGARVIAAHFGVSKGAVDGVIYEWSWTHVPRPSYPKPLTSPSYSPSV